MFKLCLESICSSLIIQEEIHSINYYYHNHSTISGMILEELQS